MDKKELRKQALEKRNALTIEERMEKSNHISDAVIRHPAFIEADSVLLYASFRSEVDTVQIFKSAISSGKKVYFPKVLGVEMEFYHVESEEDFETGTWGILEPRVEAHKKYIFKQEEKSCMILPGAVFDKAGNRIGYGRGYYDRFLSSIEPNGIFKIGIAFSCQIIDIEAFPKEEHDVCLDALITECDSYLW